MPSLEEVKAFRQQMFNDSMALIEKKGHDYNREQQHAGDTLFNLRVAEMLKIVPTAERGILVRLSDKFMRLISLMTPGVNPANAGESLRDTVKDIHNYTDYALQLWEERQTQRLRETTEQLTIPVGTYTTTADRNRICAACGREHTLVLDENWGGECCQTSGCEHAVEARKGRLD